MRPLTVSMSHVTDNRNDQRGVLMVTSGVPVGSGVTIVLTVSREAVSQAVTSRMGGGLLTLARYARTGSEYTTWA